AWHVEVDVMGDDGDREGTSHGLGARSVVLDAVVVRGRHALLSGAHGDRGFREVLDLGGAVVALDRGDGGFTGDSNRGRESGGTDGEGRDRCGNLAEELHGVAS